MSFTLIIQFRSVEIQPSWIEKQSEELERYRTAVHRMGEDILRLNSYINQLQEHNQKLKRQLACYDNIAEFHLESSNIDGINKVELAERLGMIYIFLISFVFQVKKVENFWQFGYHIAPFFLKLKLYNTMIFVIYFQTLFPKVSSSRYIYLILA